MCGIVGQIDGAGLDAAAPARHKETAHYAAWRDAVAPMMAAPRTSVKLANVFPPDAGW